MKKMIFILMLVYVHSSVFGFEGCGEYIFKGKLKQESGMMIYVVYEHSRSEMRFNIPLKEDVQKLALMLDAPSSFKAKILKPMDGTKGEIQDVNEISKRFPNPLSADDTGIKRTSSLKCH